MDKSKIVVKHSTQKQSQARMIPKISYLICTVPRTGSGLLCSGLTSTGICGNPETYFHRKRIKEFRVRDIVNYAAGCLNAGISLNGVFGVRFEGGNFLDFCRRVKKNSNFKSLTPAHIVESIFPNPRYIYLKRRDTLRQAISLVKARQTGQWQSSPGKGSRDGDCAGTYKLLSVFLTQQSLIARDNIWRQYFKKYQIIPMTLIYEDYVGDYQATIRSICRFVGVEEKMELQSAAQLFEKMADESTETWVRKYEKTPKILLWLLAPVGLLVKWKFFILRFILFNR